jgi:hypothetical protein
MCQQTSRVGRIIRGNLEVFDKREKDVDQKVVGYYPLTRANSPSPFWIAEEIDPQMFHCTGLGKGGQGI